MALENVSDKLFQMRQTLKTAKPLPRKRDRLKVAIGSMVDLIDQKGQLLRYILVDSLEANPADGRISVSSPLGQSLINKRASDTVVWQAGIQTHRAKLVGVH